MNFENRGPSPADAQPSHRYKKKKKVQRGQEHKQLAEYFETVALQDLDVKKRGIANGNWGYIDLVQMKNNEWSDRAFALKRIKKSHINRIEDQQHILTEKKILSCIKCNFIARFYKAFQDSKNLYILMEFCQGGDLWTITPVESSAASFYTACMVEALCYLHQRNIIHRDVKAENVALDAKGYAKLIDFGLSRRLKKNEKAMEVCGTPRNFAPEVLRRLLDNTAPGYNTTVDLWCLGQMVYYILTNDSAFDPSDRAELTKGIFGGMKNHTYWCNECIPEDAKSVILELCQEQPNERLGCKSRGGFAVLRQHRWFREINWTLLRDGRLAPPMIPPLAGPIDTIQFVLPLSEPNDSESEDTQPGKDTQWAKNFESLS